MPINAFIESLLESLQSIQLATLNNLGQADISYTPFLYIKKAETRAFYIFISDLAKHTANIKYANKLSAMFIQDEISAKNIFARERLILECKTELISRDTDTWSNVLTAFELKHGKTVGVLKTLPDFHLFQLTTLSGNFVQGFGKAYKLTGKNLMNFEQQTTR